jgi:hypothetical protein
MTDEPTHAIQFWATIFKVQTLVDGGIRLTLDLPETAIPTASKLMECRARGGLLEIAAVAIEPVKLSNPPEAKKAKDVRVRRNNLYSKKEADE